MDRLKNDPEILFVGRTWVAQHSDDDVPSRPGAQVLSLLWLRRTPFACDCARLKFTTPDERRRGFSLWRSEQRKAVGGQ